MPIAVSSRANFLHFIGAKRFLKPSSAGNAENLFFNKNWNKYIDDKDYDGIARSMNDCGLLKKPSAIARVHTDNARQKQIKLIVLITTAKDKEVAYNYGGLTCRGEILQKTVHPSNRGHSSTTAKSTIEYAQCRNKQKNASANFASRKVHFCFCFVLLSGVLFSS